MAKKRDAMGRFQKNNDTNEEIFTFFTIPFIKLIPFFKIILVVIIIIPWLIILHRTGIISLVYNKFISMLLPEPTICTPPPTSSKLGF